VCGYVWMMRETLHWHEWTRTDR